MTISKKDLTYWYCHFKALLSGWTTEEQIQFHQHAINQLRHDDPKGDRK